MYLSCNMATLQEEKRSTRFLFSKKAHISYIFTDPKQKLMQCGASARFLHILTSRSVYAYLVSATWSSSSVALDLHKFSPNFRISAGIPHYSESSLFYSLPLSLSLSLSILAIASSMPSFYLLSAFLTNQLLFPHFRSFRLLNLMNS